MKKLVSLFLCGGLLLGLNGCSSTLGADSASSDSSAQLAVDDSSYTLLPEANATTTVAGNGQEIAFVAAAGGLENGVSAAAWSGVQKFCQTFGFAARSYEAVDSTEQAAEEALRTAAESNAEMVVCADSALETPLFNLQSNYPTTNYLMLDGEPHNSDYSVYSTAPSTHCVLFREEQAGYLAGYATVLEGYTELGFLGAEPMPSIVRYGTGFLQGAEAAAEQNGAQVTVKYWYSDSYEADDDIYTRMSGWYADGTQVVFACGGSLAQSCTKAAEDNGGHVITADYNQSALSTTVITSADKALSRTVQNQLYAFFANGAIWPTEAAGTTEQVGVSTQAVELPATPWGFVEFTRESYDALYERLRNAEIKVQRYSDTSSLPELQNLMVDYQNQR